MDKTRKTISPYDLTAADNSGAVISQPLLKRNNYEEWACNMKTTLYSRKKFGFIDGSIKKPNDESDDLEDWLTINALLVSWIKNSIEPELRTSISHRSVAKDLWDSIKKRFSVMSGPRIQQIREEIALCKQGNLSVESYYGRISKLWDDLETYKPPRSCKCSGCTCKLSEELDQDREEDKLHAFIKGLDHELYQGLKTNLLNRVPLPSLDVAYNATIQEEDMRFKNTSTQPEVTAFSVQTKGKGRHDDKGRLGPCKHCNKMGHTSDGCFLIIGFPEWWEDKSRSRGSN